MCTGTAACPPYHLAFVVGGLSAEQNLKTVKMASARYYDNLHTTGNAHGRAFRDVEMEKQIHELTQTMGELIFILHTGNLTDVVFCVQASALNSGASTFATT